MPDVLNQQPAAGAFQRLVRNLHLDIPQVWVRFLLAMAGLALAFGAALFSTISRESGNIWATLILASAALLIAVIVGMTTVPYLARRVAAGRIRDVFAYDVTRVGIIYVIAVVLIGIAALNTGNNLLYIIVAAMLAAIVVSGLCSALVLRGLELDVRLPEHVFAQSPIVGRIILRNQRRWLPSFSVTVVSLEKPKASKRWQLTPATFAFPSGRPPQEQWIRLPDRRVKWVADKLETPGIFHGSAYFPYLPAGSEHVAELELRFERRGRYQQNSFGLATRFPFAFLTKTRRVPLMREIIVYPPVEPPDDFFEVLPLVNGEFETFARGRGHDLYRIREYMPEDSARHVDWKATAKSGSLKVREFSREDEPRLCIIFDNPGPGAISNAAYEHAIALTASLAWHFARENAQTGFVAQGYSGAADVYQFLAHLATIEPKASRSAMEDLTTSAGYNLIVTAQPRNQIPPALLNCSHVIFMGSND
jgi:uncharacterized protein (DUF58 family)